MTTKAEIVIDNDVILDGEGNLTVDGNDSHRVFLVFPGVTAELHGLTVTGGLTPSQRWPYSGGGILNRGKLILVNSIVRENTAEGGPCGFEICTYSGGGISSHGELVLIDSTVSGNTVVPDVLLNWSSGGGIASGFHEFSGEVRTGSVILINSTVSGNTANSGAGISNGGGSTLMLTNSTVSGNQGGGIYNAGLYFGVSGTLMLTNSTVSRNQGGSIIRDGTGTVTHSLIDGDCGGTGNTISNGDNIESPGNTCGFDEAKGDQIDVSADDLNLGPLQNNGGPTETHEPGGGDFGPGSVAIDRIPQVDCVDADGMPLTTDQRGVTRPQGAMCDVGAFEVEP